MWATCKTNLKHVIGKRCNGQTNWPSKSFASFHLCTMDALGKVYFNSPLSCVPSPDYSPRKGGWQDEGSCRVFPGKPRITVTIANLHHALWSLAPVAIKATRKGKSSEREGGCKQGGKAKSKDHVVFSPGNAASSVSKAKFLPALRRTAPWQPRRQGCSRTPCAPDACVDCRRLTW